MQYLTSNHEAPSPRSTYGIGTVETQILIDRDDAVTLAGNDIYAHYTEEGDAPLGYDDWSRVASTPADYYDRARSGTQAELDEATVAQTRDQLQREIDAQVPDGGARQLVEDALFEGQIQSYSGGASELKSDLENTPDAELDAFNTTIHPTPLDGTGYIQAKMTTFVDIVDPWAGAPDAIYALRCALKIVTTGQEAAGESARAHMFNEAGVDQGVIPFTQDAEDPSVWWSQSQVGRYWVSPDTGALMRLLWDSGSIAVAETKTLAGYGDRQYAIVRAGLPGRSGGTGGGTTWLDSGATVIAQAGKLYRISDAAVASALTPGQQIKFTETGTETTFTGVWAGGADYVEIAPFVQAAVGDALWIFG